MTDEQGKGEKRLEPVEVDVLDNLINAQAAYLEALDVAYQHYGIRDLNDEISVPLFKAMGTAAGGLLMTISAGRA